MDNSKPEKRLYSLRDAAFYLDISPMTLRRLVWAGRLDFVQFGRAFKFDVQDLDEFVASNKKKEMKA